MKEHWSVLWALWQAWGRAPELRFGQLMAAITSTLGYDPFYMSDTPAIQAADGFRAAAPPLEQLIWAGE